MFLNLIDPGASRTQLTVCTHPGPEPRVGSAPGAELCSEQFTASKLLKMATCLTSAESNNWDFFFFFYSAAERSSSRMLSRGKLACMNGMKGIMTWWDPFCGICKINIWNWKVWSFFHLSWFADRMGAGRKQQNENPHCFRFLKLCEYIFLEYVENMTKATYIARRGKRKISARGLLRVYYDVFSYS